jgi:hypothetical protein
MPRNASGTYSLPAGNPVVSGSVISSTWANPTLADVANELTNSLSRNGQGGMLVPFEFTNGTFGAPGITWASETSTGFYRPATSDMRATVAGIPRMRWTNVGVDVWDPVGAVWVPLVNAGGVNFIPATGGTILDLSVTNNGTIGGDLQVGDDLHVIGDLTVDGTSALAGPLVAAGGARVTGALTVTPTTTGVYVMTGGGVPNVWWANGTGAADGKLWDFNVTTNVFQGRAVNDAINVESKWITVTRTGMVINEVRLPSSELVLTGVAGPLGSVLTLIQDSGSGPMMLMQNRAINGTNHRVGALIFSPYRDVAYPVYGAGIWAEASTPIGYTIDLYLGAQNNGTSSTMPVPQLQINTTAVSVLGGIPLQLVNSAGTVVRGMRMNTSNEIEINGRGGVLHWAAPSLAVPVINVATSDPAGTGQAGTITLVY